jgi:spore germination protein GerM
LPENLERKEQDMSRKKIAIRVILVLVGVLFTLTMTGCGILEELVGKEPVSSGLAQLVSSITKSEPVISPGVVEPPSEGRTQTVTLFFTDARGEKIFQESREMPHTLSVGRETVRQWLSGPGDNSSLQRTVSASTVLRDINIKDGVATVDLSRDFLEVNGSTKTQIALYSLVNTMCQFSTVNEVVLFIDGKPLEAYHGISAQKLQWRGDLLDLAAQSVNKVDDGFRVEADMDTDTRSENMSPSSINIFQ